MFPTYINIVEIVIACCQSDTKSTKSSLGLNLKCRFIFFAVEKTPFLASSFIFYVAQEVKVRLLAKSK